MYPASTRVSKCVRWTVYGLAVAATVVAMTSDADARARRKRFTSHGGGYTPPYASIVVDANSGRVLEETNPDSLRHPASLTKIMTLYLLFERLDEGKVKLGSQFPVSAHAASQAPSKLGLKPGSTISAEDAIRALVTKSANDAAAVIAEALAGEEEDFAELMTRKARAIGMSKTVYRNASGLPDPEQVTTARDQATLGRAIQERFPRYYTYFSTPSFTFRGTTIRNHNRLVGHVEGVDGIKTGYTHASGFNLVTSMKRNGRHVVGVVLGGRSAGARDARMRELVTEKIAEASPKRTAPMIADAEAARPAQKPAVAVAAVAAAAPKPTVIAAPKAAGAITLASAGSVPVTLSAKPAGLPSAGSIAEDDAQGSSDPIRPIKVKTVKVKLNSVRTASLPAPATDETVSTQTLPTQAVSAVPPQPQAQARTYPGALRPAAVASAPVPAVATAPVATVAPVIAVERSPAPVATIAKVELPKAEAKAEPVKAEPIKAEPAKVEARGEPARAVPHSGWIVQVGAFPDPGEAKQRLQSAQTKAKALLGRADAFTETVVKGDKTLYRARFAGLDKDAADAVCKHLKRNEIACLTIKN